ncbi:MULTISPECIES: MBL fold metallo-hydrolase [unclassified Pseudomonas]|uniref:MBL fold metallo-hydrolase n=1 Tax=unclassified Pseudomonas TaxID=196821 RepID=UPI0011A91CA0|nr:MULTISPECIES: MBL fold metallo-hydrolase [unclassified Pseudomonas]TWC20607.1 L-ascorbate metabolism protein UlaG (beta-lactamase superfamily) [Pseudomonas sp. SJZ075]TWC36037.1 L-ascorbate metabolism protein UlaG (beta-lactamase superfamily) [Pseudomonas sp. SJZ078]TWC56905.1 L-ascorbate metabolism protein UlaG (beta-lactamase superfamily) [Pseudomonas sp. SJZ124]TWC92114.1 L-ascorbate metabolism protein UlaG (beta-lactamase superfamily) [Pseudomonas sp. SJZ101]
MSTPASSTDSTAASPASRHEQGKFRNHAHTPREGFGQMLRIIWNMLLHKPRTTRPAGAITVQPLTRAELLAAPNQSVFRLGHSTVLLKLRDKFWITDPVFSDRASPVQWAGPKRFHQPPISLDELPPIEAVILSHDHYDHLDHQAILKLAAKTRYFLTPLGVGDTLVKWGIEASKVRQLDWWQRSEVDGIEFIATPSQHFSGRGLFDGNSTLWASWVMIDGGTRIFFSGDTGYFDGFKRIGERYGPFDLTLMETGAYNVDWPHVHMQPEQTLQAHIDLRGRWLLPIHNGTFDLAMHAWFEPFDRILALAWERNVSITTPQMGEAFTLTHPHRGRAWWLDVEASAYQNQAGAA